MSHLVAIVYDDPHRADEVRVALMRLQTARLLELEDACVVVKDAEGRIRLHQSVPLTAAGAIGGAFWGSLVGLLFLAPLAGMAVGAAAGALSGKLTDYGISDDFMRELAGSMPAGSSAIFMLVRRATLDRVGPEIARFGGRILHTSVSQELEEKFRAMLAAPQANGPGAADPSAAPQRQAPYPAA